jgi:hypothetical protein
MDSRYNVSLLNSGLTIFTLRNVTFTKRTENSFSCLDENNISTIVEKSVYDTFIFTEIININK